MIEQSNRLEAEVSSLAHAAGLDLDKPSTILASKRLAKAGIVNSNYAGAVQELVSLRNEVAHGRHVPTREEADRYTQAVREITQVSEMLIERAYPRD